MTSEAFAHLQALIEQYLLRPGSAQERIVSFADRAAADAYAARRRAATSRRAHADERAPGRDAALSAAHFVLIAKTLREGQQNGEVRTDLDAGILSPRWSSAL
jgi:hypothetical protein